MKTAISLPDPLFREAEEFAQANGLSRSQLYAQALQFFLAWRQREEITARLNDVYAEASSQLDPAVMAAQVRSVTKDEW